MSGTDNDDSISLNKFISDTGICSRREADKLIQEGLVTLNGLTAKTGNRVQPGDKVLVNGKLLKAPPQTIYLAFNKPVGITCTTDIKEKGNIISYINYPQRIFPIGRLDKPSEGLIFLTNDGNIVNKILRAGNNHQKEYVVTVNKLITPQFIQRMGNGIPILGTVTKKCLVKQNGPLVFTIVLTQGLNRQIRRMCEFLGYSVVKLKRVRIMNIDLGKLPVGKWRLLTPQEINTIQALVASSVKTEEASKLPLPIKRKR
jgi:23S rRNA pseudouridine2604 synthase